MNKENLEVLLTNQSFQEAGGNILFPNLQLQGIITVEEIGGNTGKDSAIEEANKKLMEIAKKDGSSHIFKVEYKFGTYGHPNNNRFYCYAIGTAYR